jgi:serine/threonine-protein kinase
MPAEPTAEQVHAQLAKILSSPQFANASRASQFLRYVTEQMLAGQQALIKESVLGTEVFNREPGYDPKADAVVRVEATKLRARLLEYYAGPGKGDPLRIDIPKGSYIPVFALVEPAPPPVATRAGFAWRAAIGAALLLAAIGLGIRFWPGKALAPVPSVAVLPFVNLDAQSESDYFSDGLTEQLTDVLAQADGLKVASRTSAFAFKGKREDAKEIAKKLHVGVLVEGSVRRSGDRVRITAQLVRADDGYHLWSKSFDRPFRDVLVLQDEISQQIARALRVTLAEDKQRQFFRHYTRDADAFDLYLKGRSLAGSFGPGDTARAIALFRQALERDPKFAMAYVGLASAFETDLIIGTGPPAQLGTAINSAARAALALDSNLAEAHASLASVLAQIDLDWAGAEREFREAIRLAPYSPYTHWRFAIDLLLAQSRFPEALEECGVATTLDSVTPQWTLCRPWVLLFQDPALAIPEYRRLQAADPDYRSYGLALGAAYAHAGQYKEAIPWVNQSSPGPGDLGALVYLFGRTGETEKAARFAKQFEALPGYRAPLFSAFVALGLDRPKEARNAALRLLEERGPNLSYFVHAPMFAGLRSDPEILAQLEKLGFSKR